MKYVHVVKEYWKKRFEQDPIELKSAPIVATMTATTLGATRAGHGGLNVLFQMKHVPAHMEKKIFCTLVAKIANRLNASSAKHRFAVVIKGAGSRCVLRAFQLPNLSMHGKPQAHKKN